MTIKGPKFWIDICLESGAKSADSNSFGALSDSAPFLGSTTSDQTKDALGASNKNRQKHVRKLVEKIK